MKYKKNKFLIFLSLPLFYCCGFNSFDLSKQNSEDVSKSKDSSFYVYKIDSINNYYLVYGKVDNEMYKIISRKQLIGQCDNVMAGRSYYLSIQSILFKKVNIGGVVRERVGAPPSCMIFDDSTIICLEKGLVMDLFESKNLSGLCLVSDN